MLVEIVGLFAAVLAVVGVVLNNHKRIACFYLWMVSNSVFFVLHINAGLAGAEGMWSLALRDIVFFGLAIYGLRMWSRDVSGVKENVIYTSGRGDEAAFSLDQIRGVCVGCQYRKIAQNADKVIENLGEAVNIKDIEITKLKAKIKQGSRLRKED